MHTEEKWRAVVGYEGLYEVSDQGRIYSARAQRLLKPKPYLEDYVAVALYLRVSYGEGFKRSTRSIHSLVAQAFLGPRPDGLVVRHLDGDGRNNHLANLRYGTHSENELDTVAHGRHHLAKREACKHGHAFTPENTYIRRSGARRCRECIRIWNTASKRRARERHKDSV